MQAAMTRKRGLIVADNRLGSRFRVNETSQISECYGVQMKAAMNGDVRSNALLDD